MTKEQLAALFERVGAWPEAAQTELVELAREIEAGFEGPYRATPEELRGIDRGLRDAAEGRFMSEAAIDAVFARHRPG